MDSERIELVALAVRRIVVAYLDAATDIDYHDAGRAASEASDSVKAVLSESAVRQTLGK